MTTGIIETKTVPTNGIAIGIASSGRAAPIEWAIALATRVYPPNTNLTWIHVVGESIDDARNSIVKEALKVGCKYIWFVDDDTVPPRDAAAQLAYVLDQPHNADVMVAGGIYCVKQNPPFPLVFKAPGEGPFWNWKVGDVFDCWGLGTGCMMIKTEVFKHIDAPYFKTTNDVGHNETDDLYFCDKVIKAGYRIQAHGGIICKHWSLGQNLVYTLPSQSYPMLPR